MGTGRNLTQENLQKNDGSRGYGYFRIDYRGVDADNPGVSIQHRGKRKQLNAEELQLLKRRQAIEPVIGHLKQDHRLDRCHLKGEQGDRLHAVLCAAGYNFRWLLRMIAKKGVAFLWPLYWRLRGVAGLPQKWSQFVAQVIQLVSEPSKLTALARG